MLILTFNLRLQRRDPYILYYENLASTEFIHVCHSLSKMIMFLRKKIVFLFLFLFFVVVILLSFSSKCNFRFSKNN